MCTKTPKAPTPIVPKVEAPVAPLVSAGEAFGSTDLQRKKGKDALKVSTAPTNAVSGLNIP